jgi:hypothetical protein
VRGRIRKEKRTRRTEASTGEMGGEREKSDERGQRGREKWRKEGEKKGDGSRGHGWGNELARRVSIAVEWGKGARGAVGLRGWCLPFAQAARVYRGIERIQGIRGTRMVRGRPGSRPLVGQVGTGGRLVTLDQRDGENAKMD